MKKSLLAGLLLAAAAAAPAETPATPAAKLERVIVFKDGYSLFAKSARVTPGADGRASLGQVPPAVLGTLWARRRDGGALTLRAEQVQVTTAADATVPCTTMAELLAANIGRKATLRLHSGEDLQGRIVAVLSAPTPAPLPVGERLLPAVGSDVPTILPLPMPPAGTGGDPLLVVESLEGRNKRQRTLYMSAVAQLETDGLERSRPDTTTTTRTETRLFVECGRDAAGKPVDVELFHFNEGLGWTPTWRLEDSKEGPRLTMAADLVNDFEDVQDVPMTLMVGVPNFRYKGELTPLALEARLRSAVQNEGGAAFSNAQFTSQIAYGARLAAAPAAADSAAPEDSAGQELYPIEVGNTTLRKGTRSSQPVWTLPVQPRERFRLDLHPVRGEGNEPPMYLSSNAFAPRGRTAPAEQDTHDVWVTMEMDNASGKPWTTGPILTLRQGMPVGQELLTYTPPGGTAVVPLTVAVNVRATWDETETGRTTNAKNWRGTDYTLVQKRGTITLTNYRKEAAPLCVAFKTGGKVEETSDDGKVVLNDYLREDWSSPVPAALNNHSDVEWNLTLQPGEKTELTYTVSYFAP